MVDAFDAELASLRELTRRKRAGYSPGADPFANFKQSMCFGISPAYGVLVRMSDKWARIVSLVGSNSANDQVAESIEDTLSDLAAYALIAKILLREGDAILHDHSIGVAPPEHTDKVPGLEDVVPYDDVVLATGGTTRIYESHSRTCKDVMDGI